MMLLRLRLVELMWAVPGNVANLLSRVAYYDNYRKSNIF